MDYIKEENKNLISLRNSIITILIVLTGGIVGLTMLKEYTIISIIWFIIGIYIDMLLFFNVLNINEKIRNNIKVMKNEQ